MRKFEIARNTITETHGNIPLSATKRTIENLERIDEINTLLAEIFTMTEAENV